MPNVRTLRLCVAMQGNKVSSGNPDTVAFGEHVDGVDGSPRYVGNNTSNIEVSKFGGSSSPGISERLLTPNPPDVHPLNPSIRYGHCATHGIASKNPSTFRLPKPQIRLGLTSRLKKWFKTARSGNICTEAARRTLPALCQRSLSRERQFPQSRGHGGLTWLKGVSDRSIAVTLVTAFGNQLPFAFRVPEVQWVLKLREILDDLISGAVVLCSWFSQKAVLEEY
ncbi:hypothetical protein BDW22DRAFT_1347129 [Trametopsis cervina]|nr:hypothetical protein BDW22DRAFT_1347129 [Trametopsis cervina]